MHITPPSTSPSPLSPAEVWEGNDLADVFSESPPATHFQCGIPSDIPRLRSIHATAGYREGLSDSKAQSLQPGFDEGFSFGATFGLKVGYILGTLEGLCSAYSTDKIETGQIRKLMKQAKQDLGVTQIFAEEYWSRQGVWLFEVISRGDEATMQEVADQHPLLKVWHNRVRDEVEKSNVQLGRFEGHEWEAGRTSI